jgi:hypothetical protein
LAPKEPYVVSGEATIDNFVNKSNFWSFNAKVEKEAVIEVPVFYFPGWDASFPQEIGTIGRIAVSLPAGEQRVEGKFGNTPVRTASNIISLISILGLGLISIYGKSRKVFA